MFDLAAQDLLEDSLDFPLTRPGRTLHCNAWECSREISVLDDHARFEVGCKNCASSPSITGIFALPDAAGTALLAIGVTVASWAKVDQQALRDRKPAAKLRQDRGAQRRTARR